MKKLSFALGVLVLSLMLVGGIVYGTNWFGAASAASTPQGQGQGSEPLNFHEEPAPGGALLGIVAVNNNADLAKHLGATATDGVVIMQVKDKGAKETGLRRGDIITAVGGQPTANLDALHALLAQKAPGDVVAVTYLRQGGTQTAQVTLGQRHEPQRPPQFAPQIMRFLTGLPLERLVSSASSFEGEDGKLVTVRVYGGTVTAVLPATATTPGGLTVQPRDGSPAEAIALGAGIHLLKQLHPTELSGVQVSDRVVVLRMSVDGQPQQTVVLVGALTFGPEGNRLPPQMMPNHRADREGENRRGHQSDRHGDDGPGDRLRMKPQQAPNMTQGPQGFFNQTPPQAPTGVGTSF